MMHRTLLRYAAVATGVVTMTAGLMSQTSGTAFSYQGRLTDSGVPANGTYDLQFTLFDADIAGAAVGTPVVADDVTVSGGLFTVMLDFGAVFDSHPRWLEVGVRPGLSSGTFTTLGARQPITPAPQALFSQAAATSVTSTSSATSDSTPWSGLTNVPAGFVDGVDNDALGALSCGANQLPKWTGAAWACASDKDLLGSLACAPGEIPKWSGSAWTCALDSDNSGTQWNLTGNAGTGGGAFLGTLDTQPFELRANNLRALRIVPASLVGEAPTLIGGYAGNSSGATGAVIGGGGADGGPNSVTGDYGTVSGGFANQAANYGTVSGGFVNQAGHSAVVGGGEVNVANPYSVVGGGANNNASGGFAAILGGTDNSATVGWAVVAGGEFNHADGSHSFVAGGKGNHATGPYSFAAGTNAQASQGSFVWSDSQGGSSPVASNGSDRFVVSASGGIWFGTHAGGSPPGSLSGFLNTSTGAYLSNGGIWTNASDRNLKEHFEAVDGRALLDTLARLPVTRWNYKTERGVQHIGPTAQDFQAAFGLGGDDKAITTLDPAGIALRAIQELDRVNRDLQMRTDALQHTVDELKAQLAALAGDVHARSPQQRKGHR